ncbi:DUF1156 domain-containing protein [Thermosynechococcus sp. HN-54]|uniref:DUF1156 domain-containing protein n=1 Tax=Thermosynechococcus sp. HN-54 TaxID=2933959 RepID=UPI00202CB7DD|nr:DUF1156 domain-containing protein [Thermosynechococcus sp. HN-54]URR36252.1 DUF1156 domain-containing protein [Thermosynechococcus sp. HN-54]
MPYRKKLIEVALPLEAINMESAREKSIRHGHPSTLHLWWARRPLAACRAVLWASLVDDPSSWPDKFPTEADQTRERQRLFDILGRIETETDKKGNQKQVVRGLVSWDDINDPKSGVLEAAQREIARCLAWERGEEPPTKPDAVRDYIAQYAPPVYDPFAGGGSIPLEAQRLGLEAHASDLNPVAVLINKALIEIPPRFKDQAPVNPEDRPHSLNPSPQGRENPSPPSPLAHKGRGGVETSLNRWYGAQGLAADVRYYGQWMRDEAFKGIGHLYPQVRVIRSADGSLHPLVPSPTGGELLHTPPHPPTPAPTGGELPFPHTPPHPPTPSPTRGEGEQERWEISEALRKQMTAIARQLRKRQTRSEEILWQALRNGQLEGRKFRRQQPIGAFVVDFFCAAERLIVEVDGSIHDSEEQQALDRQRQRLLESLGLRFVRLRAEAVETDLAACLHLIKSHFLTSSSTPLSPRGRGAGGEGAESLTVIAWLWARTVKCPNPACGCQMPLVRSFQLSTKKGKEAWVEPVIDRHPHPINREEGQEETLTPLSPGGRGAGGEGVKVRFVVKSGQGKAPEGTAGRKGARCIACETPVPLEYIRQEGRAGRMGQQLMAIVAEGQNGRVYLAPTEEQEAIANSAQPTWKPDTELICKSGVINAPLYGMTKHADLFTPRQLVALTTFSDLVGEAREKATQDAIAAGLPDDNVPLHEGGTGARAYGEAIATYLAFAVDRSADKWAALVVWDSTREAVEHVFGRQAIPMVWDFAEANPFSDSTGNFNSAIEWIIKVLDRAYPNNYAKATQHDATAPHPHDTTPKLISTDPPYYDNIGYADLADFFYVWLRRSLSSIYPDLFSTLLVPKAQELVATPYRFGGSREKAREFFETGLGKAFQRINQITRADYPTTIYYAFKQTEEDSSSPDQQGGEADIDDPLVPLSRSGRGARGEGRASTGWETMLEGLIQSGFTIDGTWPMRSEMSNRMVASGTNALSSSIVLVCRPRPADAPKITRRQFLTELKRELPKALRTLQQGNIAPVDLAQASIGPGMAVYSRYAAVLENNGTPLRVRTALQLINQTLDEYLTEQEGEFDSDTRWALTWFEQHQFNAGAYGDAETLSKAKNTTVQGMVEAGIVEAKGGKVRLIKREALSPRAREEQGISSSLSPRGRGVGGEGNNWLITQLLIHTFGQTRGNRRRRTFCSIGRSGHDCP